MLVVERWVGLSLPALWLSAPVGQAVLPHSPVPGAAGTGTPLPLCGGAVWPPSEACRSPTEEGHHGGKGAKSMERLDKRSDSGQGYKAVISRAIYWHLPAAEQVSMQTLTTDVSSPTQLDSFAVHQIAVIS